MDNQQGGCGGQGGGQLQRQGGCGQGHGGGHGCGGHGQHGGDRGEQDHIEYTARLWKQAFHEALHEIRVELMKEQIRSLWGAQLQETAKGTAEAMRADWQKFWAEHAEELEPEADDAERRLREAVRAAIKKGVAG